MSDTTVPETVVAQPTEQSQLTEEIRKAIEAAKGSTTNKVWWWILGFLGVLLSLVGILAIIKGKGPLTSAEEEIQRSKYETNKADMIAKAEAAAAQNAEQSVIDKLNNIATIKDERNRMDEYAKLLQQ